MLTCFPDPYPDEIFYSICARFSDRMQYPAKNAAIQALFGRYCRAIVDLPNHLAAFINNLPPGHNHTISQIIDKHTLLPFYGPFLLPERSHKIRARMQEDGTGRTIQRSLGSSQRYMHSLERLRFCPQCIEEDKQQLGECYWHRAH
jgi:TniQ